MALAVALARPGRRYGLALPALALAYGTASGAIALGNDLPTTYAATSAGAAAVDLTAGLGLLAAGLLAWWERRPGSTAPVTMLLGAVWLAPDWVGWPGGPALARSLGMIVAPFLLPLLVHLVLAFPRGRIGGRATRFAVALAYGAAGTVSVGRGLVRDPFLDPYCWRNCTDNVFLLHAEPGLARALDDLWLWLSAAAGLLLVAVAVWRLLACTPVGRAALWAVLVPVALAGGAEASYAIALWNDPAEVPNGAVFQALFYARALALACVAGGMFWILVRGVRTRSVIGRLVADLGAAPVPGSLQAALAKALGDPGLQIAYWLPGSGRYVDAGGRAFDPARQVRHTATSVVRGGEPVALVLHDGVLPDADRLEREIGAAGRLALDNERLRAEVLAQVDDLRASRARVVQAADTARRSLERDLHDGAQQRLLALSYDLRLAHSAAEREGDRDAAARLAGATSEAQAALEELRDLAQGIYPAILGEAGLAPALATLADAALLPVEVTGAPPSRYPAHVETTAYVVVATAIAHAAERGASHASVQVTEEDAVLAVEVADDGPPRGPSPIRLDDRVGALGGRLVGGTSTLRAELPCG